MSEPELWTRCSEAHDRDEPTISCPNCGESLADWPGLVPVPPDEAVKQAMKVEMGSDLGPLTRSEAEAVLRAALGGHDGNHVPIQHGDRYQTALQYQSCRSPGGIMRPADLRADLAAHDRLWAGKPASPYPHAIMVARRLLGLFDDCPECKGTGGQPRNRDEDEACFHCDGTGMVGAGEWVGLTPLQWLRLARYLFEDEVVRNDS